MTTENELLDLRFLELDVLARNRVVLGLCHLFRHRAAVLLRYVEEAGVSGRQKLDLDRRSLGHIELPALYLCRSMILPKIGSQFSGSCSMDGNLQRFR